MTGASREGVFFSPYLNPDLTGQKFNRWTVLEYAGRHDDCHWWKCRCDCGTIKDIRSNSLRNGQSISCGCHRKEALAKNHGGYPGVTKHPLNPTYNAMIARCYNPKNNNYHKYGLRGITVCDEWLEDRTRFFEWAYMNGYEKGLTLDRIDCNGNYCPDNCRWATWDMQANNKRTSRYIEYDGKRQTLTQWAKEVGINTATLRGRIKNGWPIEKALFTPPLSRDECGRVRWEYVHK